MTFLLIWLVLATLLNHVLVIAPLDIKRPAKKALYYAVLAPALALDWIKERVAKTSLGATLTTWFKKAV